MCLPGCVFQKGQLWHFHFQGEFDNAADITLAPSCSETTDLALRDSGDAWLSLSMTPSDAYAGKSAPQIGVQDQFLLVLELVTDVRSCEY
jgi:hypothetical protein